MHKKKINRLITSLFVCVLSHLITGAHAQTQVTRAPQVQRLFADDEDTFVFAGRCPNAEPYRIFSYSLRVDGLAQSFYDYEGPAGKGTVRTNAVPKKMVARVCHALADIQNGSKFD